MPLAARVKSEAKSDSKSFYRRSVILPRQLKQTCFPSPTPTRSVYHHAKERRTPRTGRRDPQRAQKLVGVVHIVWLHAWAVLLTFSLRVFIQLHSHLTVLGWSWGPRTIFKIGNSPSIVLFPHIAIVWKEYNNTRVSTYLSCLP